MHLNVKSYVDHECLILSALLTRGLKEILFTDMLSIENGQKEWYRTNTNDQMSAIQGEAVNIAKTGAYVPLQALS